MINIDLLDFVNDQKRKQKKNKQVQKVALGMGLVSAISVVAGIIFATKRRKKMRKDLHKSFENTLEVMKDTVNQETEAAKNSVANA